MQATSEAYQAAMKNQFLFAPFEIDCLLEVINQEAQEEACLQPSALAYYSSYEKAIFVDQEITKPYASGEANYTKLDQTSYFLPKPKEAPYYHQGAVSEQLAQEDGKMTQTFSIQFDNGLTYEIKGLCIHFYHTYPTSLAILDKDGTLLKQYENDQMIFKTNDVFLLHKGMKLQIQRMKEPMVRCHISYIEFGMYVQWNNDNVISMEYHQQIHPLNNTCYIADLALTCINQNGEYDTENPSSVINFLERLQDVRIQLSLPLNEGKETMHLAHLYLNEWSSNEHEVTFKAVDAFAFLDRVYYQRYDQVGSSAYALCEAILQDAECMDYEINPALKTIMIENPLPKGTHKEALQLLCHASQRVCYQDRLGRIIIRKAKPEQSMLSITKHDMINGCAIGNKLEQVKQLEVTYTNYQVKAEEEQLIKGNYPAGKVLIEFNEPVATLSLLEEANAKILNHGPYFVTLEIKAEHEVILMGKKYQEVKQHIVSTLNERGVIKQVDNTLVSSKAMAQQQSDWICTYLRSDRFYQCEMRGRMELDPLDVVGIENDFNADLQILIDDLSLSFHGDLTGKISGRKVML